MLRFVICSFGVAALGGGCGARSATTPTVGLYEKYELAFTLPHPMRAADDVQIRAIFMTPTGREVVVGGFPRDDRFVVRFAPTELGEHSYEIRADGGEGEREVAAGIFAVVPSESRGFVRVDPVTPHRLLFDDGAPFFILGENRINLYDPSWNYEQLGIGDYVAYMASFGMTTLRVFFFSDCEHEEGSEGVQPGCLEPAPGRFDERVAARFDEILEAARAHDVYVVLALYAIGFTPGETWKSWHDNPYSAERGGCCERPADFFVDSRARAGAERRLRYVLDRWSYSTHLLAIDLLNEPEWDGAVDEAVWIPWAVDLGAAARRIDPHGHLVTAGSVGLHWNGVGDERVWWDSPSNGLVQWHLYGEATYDPHAHALEMRRKVAETWEHGKPVFCGEFAYGGEDKSTYDHTHTGIWSALFSGAGALAHSAPPFNIDSDELMTPERGRHFRVLADFLAGLDAWPPLTPRYERTRTGLYVFELGAPAYRALWVLGPAAGYGGLVADAVLTVPALAAGEYVVEWWDDVSGRLIAASRFVSTGGDVEIAVPSFVRHVAAKIAPAHEPR